MLSCPFLKLRLGKRDIVHHVHDAEAGAACDLKNSGRMILFLYKHVTYTHKLLQLEQREQQYLATRESLIMLFTSRSSSINNPVHIIDDWRNE
jgi:hypothetical protein